MTPVQRSDIAATVAKVKARPLPDLKGARVHMVTPEMTNGGRPTLEITSNRPADSVPQLSG